VRARLADGGLFCQWLPLHQLDLQTLRSIVRSFLQAFPQGTALLASNSLQTPVLGLLGHAGSGLYDAQEVQHRLDTAAWPEGLAPFDIDDAYALLGSFVAGPGALARWSGQAPLNTDDEPVVSYLAPRITYRPDSLPGERLLTLLGAVEVAPGELLRPGADPAVASRLARYMKARRQYLEAGRNVRPAADVRDMLAQVREPLLNALRTSSDFRPAYDPLLRMAAALWARDPAAASELLQAMAGAQPSRPEARALLLRLQLQQP
jgi:spermidine synthase